MSHQVPTRVGRIKLFLWEYYPGNTAHTNILRVIGGPIVIGCGVHLYYEPARFAISYGGFCFLYGVYYLFKPLFIITLRASLFRIIRFSVFLDEAKLELQESGATTIIEFSSFESVLCFANYYSIKTPGKVTIYLKKEQLAEQEVAILNRNLTA